MADPLRSHEFYIGRQTRLFKWNHVAWRIMQKKMEGKPVLDSLSRVDMDVLCEFGAAGLTGAGDPKASADRIGQWLDDEPEIYVPFLNFVVQGVLDSHKRRLPPDLATEAKKKMDEIDEAARAIDEAKRKTPPESSKSVDVSMPPPSGTDGQTSMPSM